MARTKTTEPAEPIIEESIIEEASPVDPWKVMRTIILPKAPKGEPNYQICSVNGKVFKIKKGVEVDVPQPIYEVMVNSQKAAEAADEFAAKSMFE